MFACWVIFHNFLSCAEEGNDQESIHSSTTVTPDQAQPRGQLVPWAGDHKLQGRGGQFFFLGGGGGGGQLNLGPLFIFFFVRADA